MLNILLKLFLLIVSQIILLQSSFCNGLIINELMFDPTPEVWLPDAEYVELFNGSDSTIDLSHIEFGDKSLTVYLPIFNIEPGDFVVLTKSENRIFFGDTSNVIGLSKWPSLNNSGDSIFIQNKDGNIDLIEYEPGYWKDAIKENGGWSIERIDPSFSCWNKDNWSFSIAKEGGTPGKPNSIISIFEDNLPPRILHVDQISNTQTIIELSENAALVLDPSRYDSLFSNSNHIQVFWSNPMSHLLEWVEIQISDCVGNVSDTVIPFVLPDTLIQEGSIVINEVLFNPVPYGKDYVELYNVSNYTYRLSDLWFRDGEEFIQLGENKEWFFPGEFLIFTEDVSITNDNYEVENLHHLHKVSNLPSFPDSSGEIVVVNAMKELVDSIYYEDSMHAEDLIQEEGIALERVHPENQLFVSASYSVGYGTPTAQNSQYLDQQIAESITLVREVFSPNNDGEEDLLSLNIHSNELDLEATVSIHSLNGELIKVIAEKVHLGVLGNFYWDGKNDKGSLMGVGTYLVQIRTYSSQSGLEKYLLPCALVL